MKYLLKSNKAVLLLILLLSAAGCGEEGDREKAKEEKKGRTLDYSRQVTFLNYSGTTIKKIDVAVADTEEKRSTGLMDVNELPPDKGMLFIFDDNRKRSFWMANTPLSLDIIFVNSEKEIVRIHKSTQPFSEENLSSVLPAKFVIETNGGFCLSHDIQEGMIVKF